MQIKLINKLKIEEIQNGRLINTDNLTFSKIETKYSHVVYQNKAYKMWNAYLIQNCIYS